MQVCPDWTKLYSVKQFEFDFSKRFDGPGFYLTATDTMLIVPVPIEKALTAKTIWKQGAEDIYRISVYNVPFDQTIYSVIAQAPVREDSRF